MAKAIDDEEPDVKMPRDIEIDIDTDHHSDQDEYSEVSDVAAHTLAEKISQTDVKERWKNRRRMAYISLIAMLLVTVLMMFVVTDKRIELLETVITYFYITMGTVICTYMGTTTWSQIQEAKNRK